MRLSKEDFCLLLKNPVLTLDSIFHDLAFDYKRFEKDRECLVTSINEIMYSIGCRYLDWFRDGALDMLRRRGVHYESEESIVFVYSYLSLNSAMQTFKLKIESELRNELIKLCEVEK